MNGSDEVEEELEAVLAIIMEGIEVNRKQDAIELRVQISPLTALDAEQSFVGFLLVLLIEKNYPMYSPSIKVSQLIAHRNLIQEVARMGYTTPHSIY